MLTLYLATAALQASMNMVFLALPIYALSVYVSPFEIGLISASGGLTYSLTARLLGSLSDRYSKNVFVMVGSVLEAAAAGLYSFVRSTPYLLTLRVMQSVGLAFFWPAIEAMIASEAYGGKIEHALAMYNVSWSTANIVSSPVTGFLMVAFNLSMPFYVSSALAAFIIAILLLSMRQKNSQNSAQPQGIHSMDAAAKNDSIQLTFHLSLFGAFIYAFNGSIVGTLFPVSATGLGISPLQIGLLFFLSNITQTLVFIFSERLIQRLERVSLLVGASLIAVSLILMTLVRDAATFAPLFIGLGFGQGILYSSTLYYILVKRSGGRGYATGSFESTLGVASFLGPLVGGASAQLGAFYPYVVGALTNLLLLATQHILNSRTLGMDSAEKNG